ncbi:hypothetical protein [Rudaea sp.]|uniref:hypothetical protein n=1 Tax=Rudaea sp. TaxID=2136325 RepID=UPI00321F78F5
MLHLVWRYPGSVRDDSRIAFSDVTLYNFSHTAGAIITDIVEHPVSELVQEFASQISEWSHTSGVDLWRDTLDNYISTLQQEGFRSWRIESAIGFRGFVIAKSVGEA